MGTLCNSASSSGLGSTHRWFAKLCSLGSSAVTMARWAGSAWMVPEATRASYASARGVDGRLPHSSKSDRTGCAAGRAARKLAGLVRRRDAWTAVMAMFEAPRHSSQLGAP